MSFAIGQRDGLLIVDVQRDFLPGGSLGVRDGDEVVPVLNRYIGLAQRKGLPVIASRDWHPGKHCSFRERGGIWPVHCVQDTPGAAFSSALALPADTPVISKATREETEAYSAFDGTDLADQLHKGGIRRLLIGGLATDYCVLKTVLDALKSGFEVLLLEDAIRAVDVKPGDGQRAKEEMRAAGAVAVNYDELS